MNSTSEDSKIRTLFCDVGGVLLTNGWGHISRIKAAADFGFDQKEFDIRHQMIFGDYEVGKISLDDYLRYTVFFKPRAFSLKDFKDFMYAQSQPHPEMLAMVRGLKEAYGLKVVILSNEGRELTEHRIRSFDLGRIADFFVVSCFVGVRKPDRQIFRMAIDMAHVPPEQIAYIDDRQLFIEVATDLGLHGICHQDVKATKAALEVLLQV